MEIWKIARGAAVGVVLGGGLGAIQPKSPDYYTPVVEFCGLPGVVPGESRIEMRNIPAPDGASVPVAYFLANRSGPDRVRMENTRDGIIGEGGEATLHIAGGVDVDVAPSADNPGAVDISSTCVPSNP